MQKGDLHTHFAGRPDDSVAFAAVVAVRHVIHVRQSPATTPPDVTWTSQCDYNNRTVPGKDSTTVDLDFAMRLLE